MKTQQVASPLPHAVSAGQLELARQSQLAKPCTPRSLLSNGLIALTLMAAVCAQAAPAASPAPALEPGVTLMSRDEAIAFFDTVKAQNMAKFPDRSYPKPLPEAIEAWKDLRFGMFIHWGPCSVEESEISWSRGRLCFEKEVPITVYDNLYKKFNPTKFDADTFVALAKSAGMRYIVLIAKHHDGFCMWPSKFTDYTIANTPFKRDIVREVAEACKRGGIKLGLYYSQVDWYHPLFPVSSPGGRGLRATYDLEAYDEYAHNQVKELIQEYGPLLTIWMDMPQHCYYGRGHTFIRMGRALQPDILFNNRVGTGGDYGTPEQKIGLFNIKTPWESCMTTSAHGRWAYCGPQDGVRSVETCLKYLIGAAGGDGNLLLNVGPTAEGIIAPEQAGLLKEIGAWMKRNGEGIIGTRGGPYKNTEWLASTRKGKTVYLHIMTWGEGGVTLPALPVKVASATVLGGGAAKVSQDDKNLRIDVPVADRHSVATVVKLTLEGNAMNIAPIELGPPPESTKTPHFDDFVENVGEQLERQKKPAAKNPK